MKPALSQFKKEIRHFFQISVLNLVFAAIALAFSVQYMVTAISGHDTDPATAGLRIVTGAIAMICFGLGIRWILSTIRIFEGVESIKAELDSAGEEITDHRITCLIVRMLAHYRDNRKTIATMILVCTLGGACFFFLGIAPSLEAFSLSSNGIAFTLNSYRVIPALLLTLGIALASLLSSYYFSQFAKDWDRRIREIDESECALKKTLGLDDQ